MFIKQVTKKERSKILLFRTDLGKLVMVDCWSRAQWMMIFKGRLLWSGG